MTESLTQIRCWTTLMPSLLITGGLGFLGQQAARHFLKGGVVFSRLRNELAPLTQLTLFDVAGSTALLPELARDSRVRVVEGDLAEPGTASELVCASGDVSIIHLASMVSGNTETDTEEGWRATSAATGHCWRLLGSTHLAHA